MPTINGETWFTIAEIAQRFSVPKQTARMWIIRDHIPHTKLVGRLIVSEKDLNEFIANTLSAKR